MQFTLTISEVKESEEIDNQQLVRMSSADLIRLKRAHKAEQLFVENFRFIFFLLFKFDVFVFRSIENVSEDTNVSAYHLQSVEQMRLKNQVKINEFKVKTKRYFFYFKELDKLEKRDLEITQIAEGKILRTKKYKISSKVRKEAFNEYMKIYLKEPKKGVRIFVLLTHVSSYLSI